MKNALDNIPRIRGSRTVGFNTILGALSAALIPVLLAFDWTSWVEPKVAGAILAAITVIQNIINVVLRYDTTGPVGNSE